MSNIDYSAPGVSPLAGKSATEAPATPARKAMLSKLKPQQVRVTDHAGERIDSIQDSAPGNDAPIGGLKITTKHGWFAARPSGTEDIYKIYAESFRDNAHLQRIVAAAQSIVNDTFACAVLPAAVVIPATEES